MTVKILNLTRKTVPQMSYNHSKSLENIRSMPEMVLARMIRQGKTNIRHVGLNSCDSVVISKNGVNLVYTDGLNGCNSVGAIVKLKDGNQLFCLSHYFPTETMRVPFRNIIYIGDSDTDIPCMKLVNSNGGHSIGVYNPATQKKEKVYKMMHDKRIKYFAPADYSEGSELDALVKAIIDRT